MGYINFEHLFDIAYLWLPLHLLFSLCFFLMRPKIIRKSKGFAMNSGSIVLKKTNKQKKTRRKCVNATVRDLPQSTCIVQR